MQMKSAHAWGGSRRVKGGSRNSQKEVIAAIVHGVQGAPLFSADE